MNYRELIAFNVMQATQTRSNATNDFMIELGLPMPQPKRRIDGALGPPSVNGLARGQFSANDLKLKCELVTQWGIGSFPGQHEYSSVYDPDSPWYNTFYGSYAFKSYKPGRVPWGYSQSGQPDFSEISTIYSIDYNFLIAWTLGCPEELLSFDAKETPLGKCGQWDVAEVEATVPSLLHVPWTARNPASYWVYGTPELALLTGRQPYEPVDMIGLVFTSVVYQKADEPPVTVAFGALCPTTTPGRALLNDIIDAFLR